MNPVIALAPFWAWSFEWAVLVWLFMLGAVVGSFLNVVVYRLPRGMSVVRPASRCPACGTPIAPRDNLPIVGWLLLAGRCRACGQPISPRYPLVELLTAVMFVLLAWYGPMRAQGSAWVQGSGFRVQQRGDRAGTWVHDSAAIVKPSPAGRWPSNVRYVAPPTASQAWGVYAYHLFLLCSLLAAGLTEFDGQRFSGRLILPAVAIGLFAPLVWPHLRLLEGGLLGGTTHAARLSALLDGALGLTAGWILGWTASALIERGGRWAASTLLPASWQLAVALALIGVFLGWRPLVGLTVAAVLLWLCVSFAGGLWPGPRLVGPVLCLTPCAGAWIVGAWVLGGEAIVNDAWLRLAVSAWPLAWALAIAAAIAWLLTRQARD